MRKTLPKKSNNLVFIVTLIISLTALFASFFLAEDFFLVCNNLLASLLNHFGWFYLIGVFLIVVTIIYLFFSKYSDIRLGDDDSKPEFSTLSWISMLFAAGMGIGLVFWGCAEPLSLYFDPPFGITPSTPKALDFSIQMSFFHWGIHPWCIYSLMGIILAYVQFRKKEKSLISRAFIPIFGRSLIKGWLGKLIDISTVFATVAGLVTSLGLGALQISRGLNYLYSIPLSNFLTLSIIGIITVVYISSAVFGLNKGIKILSNFNLILAFILLISIIVLGPTTAIFNALTAGIGDYLSSFVKNSLYIESFGVNTWTADWTIFMWATWIAWTPMVGAFIARISKGRTIKEFILAVVLVPTLISIFWFSAFGILSLNVAPLVGKTSVADPALTLFMVLKQYNFGEIISVFAILLLSTFFVTSADSAVFVLGIMTSNGQLNPPVGRKVLWGLLISSLTFCILRAGGLNLIKTISILGAFPFLIFLMLAILALFRHLYLDRKTVKNRKIRKIIYKVKSIKDIQNI